MKISKAELGLIFCSLAWGLTFVTVKESLSGIHPYLLVCYRFGMAALPLAALLVYRRIPLRGDLVHGLILGVILALLYLAQTLGLVYTSAANSGFITGLFIAFVPVFGILFFRKRFTRWHVLSVICSLFGLYLLVYPLSEINRGDVYTLVCSAAYALHVLWIDRLASRGVNAYRIAFHQFWVVSILSAVAASIFDVPFILPKSSTTLSLVFLALIPTLLAFVIQVECQRSVSAIRASLIFILEPVFAALFAWTWGGEDYRLLQIMGGTFIVIAMFISELGASKLAGSPSAPGPVLRDGAST